MEKKPNDSAKAPAVGHSLGSSLEEINAVATRVIERVVGTSSDTDHAALGHRLLLFLLTAASAAFLPNAWVKGVLDDSAFPAEERSTLANIVFPRLCGGAYSASGR